MSKTLFDPRTIGRDIPGVFDSIFPQLTPGVVAHFNRDASYVAIEPVETTLLHASSISPAMLAEIGYALGEQRLAELPEDWERSVAVALERQRRHFDAVIPKVITESDRLAAYSLANNLVRMTEIIQVEMKGALKLSPVVRGFQWIASGVGDIQIGSTLVEVKFSARNFSSADYRQVAMYWLLDQLASLEVGNSSWNEFILLNPKLGISVRSDFASFIQIIGAGRTTVEIAQMFSAFISTRSGHN